MSCYRHRSVNYRLIGVMFWAFPYLLWQAFGNPGGFVIGVVLALMLTAMLNSLFTREKQHVTSPIVRQVAHEQDLHTPSYEEEYQPYQAGYRAETSIYRAEVPDYHAEPLQAQYEEMQISYPQELPPMEQ